MKRILVCSVFVLLFAALLLPAQTQQVQSFALNPYVSVLDGQWEGIKYASDGNVYFASSTHSLHHGAAFFKYTSATGQVTLLTDDITKICGEDPQTNSQGKIHSDIIEANGWLYFSTYYGADLVPGSYANYSGSHVIGYQLSTGAFRDYGVILHNYTAHTAIAVDPVRGYIYVFLTGELPGQVSYVFRVDLVTGAKTNLGQVGGTYSSCFYMFLDQRGDVWFSVEYGNATLIRIHGDTGAIQMYPNALPPIYLWSQPVVDPSSTNQSLRQIHWMQPLDGDRAVFTEGYYGGMLYIFDSSKPIGSGQEFTAIQHIGYTDLGLALGNNRVFYHQRANRGCGHQGDGQQISVCGPPPAGGVKDFHLMSVSLSAADNYAFTDYGLLQDQSGRLLWRAPGMYTDRNNHVYLVGDWYTIPGDVPTSSYQYDSATGAESYVQLDRGEFFAVATLGSSTAISVAPASVTLGQGQTQQFTAVPGDPNDLPLVWSVTGAGGISPAGLYSAPATIASTQTVTIKAASSANNAHFGTATVILNPPPSANSATFVTADTTTHGSWKGVYGGDGEVVIGDSSALPSYAQLTVGGQVATYTWLPSTTLINAPQKINASDRIAACWYTNGSIVFDLTLAGSTPHAVALYAFDFDAAKRVERIDVLDAVSGLQLDTRTISNFSTGTYLVWNITGHVQFRVTVLSGVNGVISGIFLGGAGAVVPPPVFTQNPSAVSATTGQTATFAVTATGTGLSYQWQSGTASFSNIGGANSASYTTPTLSAADNGTQFRCVVTNTGGSATSTAATLTVTSSRPVITQNPVSVSVTAGQTATFAVAATGAGLSYQWQSGTASFSNIGGANSASYTTPVLSIANSGTQFRCVVTNGGGSATSTAATLTVTTGTSPNGAAFVTTDTTTQGTWRGTYGGDGYLIAGDSTSPPNYGTVSFTGQLPYVWDNLTQATRALQRGSPTATTRIAGVWYSPSSFTIDVTLTSGAHQMALYALDWDAGNRSERIDVIDPATNQVIDTRTISSFVNGTYLVWNVTGHVQLRVTLLGGLNAVIAGIFFGSGQAAANTQPVITQNPGSATVVAGQTASFMVAATGGGLGYQWQSQAAGGSGFANIGGATGSTYTTPALAITDNGTQYRCLVTNTIGSATSTAATVTVNAAPPGTSAIYVASDTTTQGAWSPTYGTQGTLIAGLAANPPSYAHATMGAVSLWNGGTGSSDPRALNGVIACWYAYPQIVLDLNLTDANYHRIALYLADWGGSRRTQTITIRDAATGAVLDTRLASDFLNGQYLTWNIRGHVMITIAVNSGPNAVLSGVFFQ